MKRIILDHDGSADDFLSLLLILTMEHIDLAGVTITPADCYAENALETTRKICVLAKAERTAIGVSSFHGINAFPAEWRAKPKILNALPTMINIDASLEDTLIEESSHVIARTIADSDRPITLVLTGPCSSLVQAIEYNPSIIDKIDEVIWMGGAIDVPGNVRAHNHNNTAEWNVFWDPISASKLLCYKLSLILIPLDITNNVPVTISFLKKLAMQSSYLYSNLAAQFWATTTDSIPSYEYTYFMWDVLATSYLAIPEAFTIEEVEIEVAASGPNAGQTFRKLGSGKSVKVATNIDKNAFYAYVLSQLKR